MMEVGKMKEVGQMTEVVKMMEVGKMTEIDMKMIENIGMDNRCDIKIDIITLARDETRLNNAMNIKKRTLGSNIFLAVDKKDTERLEKLRQRYDMGIVNGQAACCLSHILIIERFLKSSTKYQVIIEDDARPISPIPYTTTQVEELIRDIDQTSDNVDILYLSGRMNSDTQHRVINGCGTEGYILTRHGAEKVLGILKTSCDLPIDIKLQSHFCLSEEMNWCQVGRIDRSIKIRAYKSKHLIVDLNHDMASNINI